MINISTIIYLFLTQVYANSLGNKIIGGSDVDSKSKLAKVSVALISSNGHEQRVFCTGTLIAKRVIITAAHCIDSLYSTDIKVAQGENPLVSTEKINITHFSYYKPLYLGEPTSSKDIAIMLLENPFKSYEIAKIDSYYSINAEDELTQLGYGYKDFEMSSREYPNFGKLQKLKGKAYIHSLNNRVVNTISSDKDFAVSFGDSGGPLLSIDQKLFIRGVLSGGHIDENGLQFAYYASPYFFINWINRVLPYNLRIEVQEDLKNQFSFNYHKHKLRKIEELLEFNNAYCKQYNENWIITKEFGCFPSTKESCIKHASNYPSGYIFWNEEENKCKVNLYFNTSL